MSGRCCSLAYAISFRGDAAAVEEAPHRALRDPQPVRILQIRRDLLQRHVRRLLDQRKHCRERRSPGGSVVGVFVGGEAARFPTRFGTGEGGVVLLRLNGGRCRFLPNGRF